MRLFDSQQSGCLNLAEVPLSDRLLDLKQQASLQKLLLGIGKPKILEDISTAGRYLNIAGMIAVTFCCHV